MVDLYTVNAVNYQRETIIEHYESFIWTDRYSAYGDLQMVVPPSLENQLRLAPGALVAFSESDRLMQIKTAVLKEEENGSQTLEIAGESLEGIFKDRIAKPVLSEADWTAFGQPGNIVRNVVNRICVNATGISPLDQIPGLTVADLTPIEPGVTVSLKSGTLYERIKQICDSFELGFRILAPTYYTSNLRFEVYRGVDRTGILDGVAFSEETESLSAPTRLKSIDNYKNVAYVYSKTSSRIVNRAGEANATGFDRRVVLVDATDVTSTGTAHQSELLQRGRDALADHPKITFYDGKVNPNNTVAQFRRDYFLGDLVILVGSDKSRQSMRVTEFIYAYDNEGYKMYPTLSIPGGV